jgi:heme/copper-type cytochrome/quinol oxidase subunit 2
MAALLAFLPVAAESAAREGKKIIIGMLIVGLVFVGVIALGQTSRWLSHRRKDRRARRQAQY